MGRGAHVYQSIEKLDGHLPCRKSSLCELLAEVCYSNMFNYL